MKIIKIILFFFNICKIPVFYLICTNKKNQTFTNMKKIKFLFLMLLTSVSTLAQVGINVFKPQSNTRCCW
jgi:hypothetical protein